MGKTKKILALSLTCLAVLGGALTGPAQTSHAEVLKYRCWVCNSLLRKMNKYSTCDYKHCGKVTYAYICDNVYCGSSYAICTDGHYTALDPKG